MKAIRQLNDKHDSVEAAQDHLAGLKHIPGFLMGYVDEKEKRAVTYHVDVMPESPLPLHRSQKRVELAFPVDRAGNTNLAPIADAMEAARQA